MKKGQYFELKSHGESNNYMVFHWTRGIYDHEHKNRENNGTYLVVFEPKEITFYTYFHKLIELEQTKVDTDQHKEPNRCIRQISKTKLLSIPYQLEKNTEELVTSGLKSLLNDRSPITDESLPGLLQHKSLIKSVKDTLGATKEDNIRFFGRATESPERPVNREKLTTGSIFQTFLLDFLWDLKVNKCFNYSKYETQVTQVADRLALLKGLYLKMHFEELSNYLLRAGKLDIEPWMRLSLQNITKDWTDFLTVPQNEVFFAQKEIERKYFHSLDDELENVLIKAKLLGNSKILSNRSSSIINFMLHRYDYLSIFKLFTNKTAYWKVVFFLSALFMLIVLELVSFFVFKNETSFWFTSILPNGFLFILGIWFLFDAILNPFRLKWKNTKETIKLFIPNLLLPKLLISIATIWIFFLGTDEVFDLFGNETEKFPWLLLPIVVVLLVPFLFIELKKTAPSSTRKKVSFRIITLFAVSFITSYIFGALAWQFSFNKRIEHGDKTEFVKNQWRYICEDETVDWPIKIDNNVLYPLKTLEDSIRSSEEYVNELYVLADWFGNSENPYQLKEELDLEDSLFYDLENYVFEINARDVFLKSELFKKDTVLDRLKNTYVNERKDLQDFSPIHSDYLNDLEKRHIVQSKIWNRILNHQEIIKNNNELIQSGDTLLKHNLYKLKNFSRVKIDFLGFAPKLELPHGILFRQSLIVLYIGLIIQILLQNNPMSNRK